MNQTLFNYKNGVIIHNRGLYRINDIYSKKIKYLDSIEITKFGPHQAFLLRSFLDYKIIFKIRIQANDQDDSALIIRILKRFSKFLVKVKVLQNHAASIKAKFLSRVTQFFSNPSMRIDNIKAYRRLTELLDSTCDSNLRMLDLKNLFNGTFKFPFHPIALNLTAIKTEKLLSLLSLGKKHLQSIKSLSLHIRNKSCIGFDDIFHTPWSQKVVVFSIETKFYSLFNNVLPNIEKLSELRVLTILVDQEFELIDVEKRLDRFAILTKLSKLECFKFKTCMQNCYNYLLWETFEFLYESINAHSLVFNLTSTDDVDNNPHSCNLNLPKTIVRKRPIKDLELNLTSISPQNLLSWMERLKTKLNNHILDNLQLRVSIKQYPGELMSTYEPNSKLFEICSVKKLKLNIMKMENLCYNHENNFYLQNYLEELNIDSTTMKNVAPLFDALPWTNLKLLYLKIKLPVLLEEVSSVLDNLKYGKKIEHVTIDLNPLGFIDSSNLIKFIDFILEIKFCCRELVIILRHENTFEHKELIINKLHKLRNHFSAQKALWRLDIRLGDFFIHKYSPNGPVKLIMDEF